VRECRSLRLVDGFVGECVGCKVFALDAELRLGDTEIGLRARPYPHQVRHPVEAVSSRPQPTRTSTSSAPAPDPIGNKSPPASPNGRTKSRTGKKSTQHSRPAASPAATAATPSLKAIWSSTAAAGIPSFGSTPKLCPSKCTTARHGRTPSATTKSPATNPHPVPTTIADRGARGPGQLSSVRVGRAPFVFRSGGAGAPRAPGGLSACGGQIRSPSTILPSARCAV
jgi:hypothetical protein